MKKYNKAFLVFSLFLSVLIYSQELNKTEILKIQKVEKNHNKYKNKKLKNLLQDLPEIKMLRIMPNNPETGVHTLIIGFLDNAQFSKSSNKKRITLYINDKIKTENLFKEDITTEEAIKKYGDLKIALILL
ncbi:hypothetical protein OMO38_19200 [Chryseobacterium sp. 09-1422]|uniref:Uncharacterized protein n=1 Tax=Chryseobacterium kimseyorum TaxID=2984028 RepID=A0ABT3I3N2_9FLAO|nr:hypothetical protein [Chryseobacterium kimseyorum]MCW3170662.1 hypothetical protein [Chryseobacterium kimseyorum]